MFIRKGPNLDLFFFFVLFKHKFTEKTVPRLQLDSYSHVGVEGENADNWTTTTTAALSLVMSEHDAPRVAAATCHLN